jgi:hypothetical protein
MEIIQSIDEAQNIEGCEWGSQSGFVIKTSEQTIKIYIDDGQSCCENFGYFVSEDDFQDFIGSNLLDITITDTCLNTKKLEENGLEHGFDGGGIMFVNLETNNGTLQFAAYNSHNGYYGHSAGVVSKTLNHTVIL